MKCKLKIQRLIDQADVLMGIVEYVQCMVAAVLTSPLVAVTRKCELSTLRTH